MTKGLTTAIIMAVVGGLLLGVTITTAPVSAAASGESCVSTLPRDGPPLGTIQTCLSKDFSDNAKDLKADCKAGLGPQGADSKCSSSQTIFGLADNNKPPKP